MYNRDPIIYGAQLRYSGRFYGINMEIKEDIYRPFHKM